MIVGYARVSTPEQNLEAQLEALKAAACEKIFQEKVSGKSGAERQQLQQALSFVREGDALVCTKLDRLARSVYDLHKIAACLNEKGCALIVVDQPLINTTTSYGKVIFSIMGAMAELERDLIIERTAEGRAIAKAAGKHLGRKAAMKLAQIEAMKADAETWMGTMTELGAKYGIGRSSVYRYLRENEK